MVDTQTIRQFIDRYPEMVSKGDVDGILERYAEDATLEDPIGSELRRGKAAIREFYQASAGTIVMKRSGAVRVAGNEAATPLVVVMGADGQQQALDIISHMVFDAENRVTSMRAFWSFDAMRPATPEDLAR